MADLLMEINSRYNQFTKAEKKVADYILVHKSEVVYMSITELGEASKVGDASVFRFCKTMKLKGYQEFKLKLTMSFDDLDKPSQDIVVRKEDDAVTLADKTMKTSVRAIEETRSLLDVNGFNQAVEYLTQAENIWFFGVGSSMITALDGMNKFLRITPKVHCLTDNHMQAMAAGTLTSKDVAIIISFSGSTKDTVNIAEIAKENGCKIISITRFIKSPLTVHSDINLLCGSIENPLQGGSISGKIGQLYLLDMLYMGYYNMNFQRSNLNNSKATASVIDKLY